GLLPGDPLHDALDLVRGVADAVEGAHQRPHAGPRHVVYGDPQLLQHPKHADGGAPPGPRPPPSPRAPRMWPPPRAPPPPSTRPMRGGASAASAGAVAHAVTKT